MFLNIQPTENPMDVSEFLKRTEEIEKLKLELAKAQAEAETWKKAFNELLAKLT